ncbi:MAG TPA: lysophospholipid acyltransferase family protein [Kofleriaceae bacterium]
MSVIDSLRVAGAMVQISVPLLADVVRGKLERDDVDDKARWFAHRVVELLEVDLHASGAERVPPGRAYVYMSNHQSHLDIPMLYATLPSPTIRMLAKKELFDIPLWGKGLRAAEFIEVDRANPVRARHSIDRAEELIRDGVSVWLAAEGTRSRDGRIAPLKKGGFHLALHTNTPIVPVAIRGTIDILPRGTGSMHKGKRVDVTIGAPIDVAGKTVDQLATQVRAFLIDHVER